MRNVLSGGWFAVKTEKQFKTLLSHGDINKEEGYEGRYSKGTWYGPGPYYVISYSRPCGRSCCEDTVYETLTPSQLKPELEKVRQDMENRIQKILAGVP
jgi:hypothetical protein